MALNPIFLVELVVEEVQIFAKEGDSSKVVPTEQESETVRCPERCVRFQLGNLARCEVCEKDFGSQLDVEHTKMGESCMFTLGGTISVDADQLNFEIAALEVQSDGSKQVLGRWKEPAGEILSNLAKNYDDTNGGTVLSDVSISKKSIPVSDTIKSMYPLLMDDGERVVGYVIVTLRISCLGPRITQKVLFGGKPDQQAVTCFKATDQVDEEQFMKCVTFDGLSHSHPVVCQPCEEPKGSKVTLPPTPPASVSSKEDVVCPPYDEYTAEMNGNAISIRVEKSSEIKVMLDGEQDGGCTKGCWTSLALPEGIYALEERYVQRQENTCRLPVIRGNLKYPARQWSGDFLMCKQKRPICAEDFRKCPDLTRSVCMQTRDPEQLDPATACGIEICKKGWHDPNVDVFVVKLGKNKTSRDEGAPNQIELELRTPKGPMREKRPKETRGVQVIEAEFEDFKKPSIVEEVKKPKKAAISKKGKKK